MLKVKEQIKKYLKKSAGNFNAYSFAAVIVLAVLLGFIVLPPVGTAINNGQRNNCISQMYLMLEALSEHFAAEGQSMDGEWHRFVQDESSVTVIERLAEEVQSSWGDLGIKPADFYFEENGGNLVLRNKKFADITDMSVMMSEVPAEKKDMGLLGWNTNSERQIKNIKKLGNDALVIDAGEKGKYCLAAWAWEEYVKEAESEGGKAFDASIILYRGTYYYYPDGLYISSGARNSEPQRYAMDTENMGKNAYCIPFDVSSVLASRFSTESHNGSLTVEDGNVYIWQRQASRELSKGWIRVYCEMEKL